MIDDSEDAPEDYVVGYGKTPKETRFKPGSSGNPRGRPKKQKSVGAHVNEALSRQIPFQGHGKKGKMRALSLIFLRLVNDATRGNLAAIKLVLNLQERYGQTAEGEIDANALAADDRAILQRYFADVTSAKQERDSGQESATPADEVGDAADSEFDKE